MMGVDVDVDVDMDVDMVVALKLPLRELAVPIGSVSGTLGTGHNTGHNTVDDNDEADVAGIQLKVAHPSIEGGVVGLRLVRLADASGGVLDPGPVYDPSSDNSTHHRHDHDHDHDTGHKHDSAAILHWNVSAYERSYIDSLKLFRVGQAGGLSRDCVTRLGDHQFFLCTYSERTRPADHSSATVYQ